jgi:hypothetical protein
VKQSVSAVVSTAHPSVLIDADPLLLSEGPRSPHYDAALHDLVARHLGASPARQESTLDLTINVTGVRVQATGGAALAGAVVVGAAVGAAIIRRYG